MHEAPAAATADESATAAPGASTIIPAAAPSQPEAKELPEVSDVAHRDSLQEAVDKAQASKSGHIGTLDGGDKEGLGMFQPARGGGRAIY